MLKRYLIFAGDNYYPLGGWKDLHSSEDNKEIAEAVARTKAETSLTWAHVVDATTQQVVAKFEREV